MTEQNQIVIPTTTADPNTLTFWCVVDGQSTPFQVTINHQKCVFVDNLKISIKDRKSNDFANVDPDTLTLWKVSIPIAADEQPISLDNFTAKQKLNSAHEITDVFQRKPAEKTIQIIVQVPKGKTLAALVLALVLLVIVPISPFEGDETEMSPPKKICLENDPIVMAIRNAGYGSTLIDGRVDLTRLDSKKRVKLLDYLGSKVHVGSKYDSIMKTAEALKDSSFEDLNLISTLSNEVFPVTETKQLYVRQAYKDLYDHIMKKFGPAMSTRRIFVTGTSGIGKSAFLVYFAIRLLATSTEDDPPIIIFQENNTDNCYVYGGLKTPVKGDITNFESFLDRPETWYLVDSSPNPSANFAKTIISVSPKTLNSESKYRELDKREDFMKYYMAPWKLDELEMCRGNVKDFEVITSDFMSELYSSIGGVPRYVLQKPRAVLIGALNDKDKHKDNDNDGAMKIENDIKVEAKEVAYSRVKVALENIKAPQKMMQCFEEGKDSLEYSSRLLHRWPLDGEHSTFHLEWASAHIADEVGKVLEDNVWKDILRRLTNNSNCPKGAMFELYVRRIMRKGDCEFHLKDLQGDNHGTLKIQKDPVAEIFKEIPSTIPPRTLCIPSNPNYACVDLLLSPSDLLQITTSQRHTVKEEPFSRLLDELQKKKWITSPSEVRLIFVVPSDKFEAFSAQNFVDKTRKKCGTSAVKQYALKIDLDEAVAGRAPGLSGPPF
ncbi:hypothetical protein BGZ65_007461 [Modicella reniformis]|uniref:Crinkler effector protein N-terminal domain-containing protein n=1 Tax=Modicella reniformis TaxID=1440133 RepID=A0A9P6LRX4_9FUNG|nr:hypothetical protein BGZ65_007461 [Modicella reniformis]